MSFCKNKHIKEYPEHRVCVIDFLPCIERAVKDTYNFFLELNVPSTFFSKNKKDLLKVFYHYTFSNLCETYQQCESAYRKVFATYNIEERNVIPVLFLKNINTVLKVCPVHWCKVTSLNSPDVGIAASVASEKQIEVYSKLSKFTKEKQLTAISSKIKKSRLFSNILVDFSTVEK